MIVGEYAETTPLGPVTSPETGFLRPSHSEKHDFSWKDLGSLWKN
jgi:hypothetical protein